MAAERKRRCYEDGHIRKFLIVADGSAEGDVAMLYAASRIVRNGGKLVMLFVMEPQDFGHWMGVREIEREEEMNKARALFRLLRRKLGQAGYEHVEVEEVIREGKRTDELTRLIDEDQDIAILALGAAADAKGPGPLITSIVTGKTAGSFPIPINIVPGNLTLEEVQALA